MTLPIWNVLIVFLLILGVSAEFRIQNFMEMTKQNGYKSEEHTVVTEDGYILTVFRITQGYKCKDVKKRTPVFFMPPLLAAADTALDAGVNASLPYLISDACFDLWLGNIRGTYYGRKHIHLDPNKDKKFWDFCVDEIGTYDAPAMVDYVLNYTKEDKLIYIGFSQGGGSFFVMCSERPGFCNDKIKLMIALAPATRHTNTKSWFAIRFFNGIARNMKVLDKSRIWEILGNDSMTLRIRVVCKQLPVICEWVASFLDSPHPGSVTSTTYQRMLDHFPAGTSVRNMVKYSQGLLTDKYVKYDYGKKKNRLIYGRPTPPEFNLTAANVPVLLITGKNDGLVDVKDVKWLASKLPNVIEMDIVNDPQWNHVDMIFSRYLEKMLFPKILKYLLLYSVT